LYRFDDERVFVAFSRDDLKVEVIPLEARGDLAVNGQGLLLKELADIIPHLSGCRGG